MSEKAARPRRHGLGKGLNDLFGIPDNAEASEEPAPEKKKTENTSAADGTGKAGEKAIQSGEVLVQTGKILANENKPRKNFEEDSMMDLVESVRQYGILQPLLVKREGENYRIIAGERRFRAAKEAGLKEVPVIIRDYSSQQAAEISIIENVQRADLNPMEEAMAYQMLIDDYGLKQEEVAEKVNKNRTTVTNALRLLKLCPEVQKMTASGVLSAGHARTLLPLASAVVQKKTADLVVERGLSVRETERLVKQQAAEKPVPKKPAENDAANLYYEDSAEKMQSILGTKVYIRRRDRKKGRIEIDYYSTAELERIMELICSIQSQ